MRKAIITTALVLTLAGCSSETTDEPTTEAAAEEAASVDVDRFDFTAPDLDTQQPVSGKELYETRPLLITFVVPSCQVCIEEGPTLAATAEQNPDVTFVFVHSNATQDEYQQYIQNSQIVAENVVHLQDNQAQLWERFGVTEQPSSVLVATDGTVSVSKGALGEDGLEAAIAKVLG